MIKAFHFLVTAIALIWAIPLTSRAQTRVQDIFGRSLNSHGITLVDWDGYLANPLIKFYVLPPTNGVLPGSVKLNANGARLYFDTSSTVSSNGPSKTVSVTSAVTGVPVNLSIFPDRDSLDEDYTLTLVFTGANNAKQTNTVPIHVIDQDIQRTNDFAVTVNFDRDVTGFFTNAQRRALAKQAADDWAYFMSGMNLDLVTVGSESTYIWSNDFSGGKYFSNTNSYRGYQLYAYGTSNATHRSGGESSYNSPVQHSGGVALTIKRSGGFEAEIYGNYNTLGWLTLTNDNDWLMTGNLGSETNDFFSIAHHEIGHALIFNAAHPGFNAAKTVGAFTNVAIVNYFGAIVPIDASEHLNGSIDPESGQGAFGYEYYGSIPRKRWTMTKLDLFCAQQVGYTLRPTSAFTPLAFPSNALPVGAVGIPYTRQLTATGSIPVFNWELISGGFPSGIVLDPFSGTLSGTPTNAGSFNFTIRVRDYHESGPGITQDFALNIGSAPAPQLSVLLSIPGGIPQAQLLLTGVSGQRQLIQASTNLSDWIPVATNVSGTNLFTFIESNPTGFSSRFYRALVLP